MRQWLTRRTAWALTASAVLALGTWTANAHAAAAGEYSTESAKASESLLIDATHAGKRLVVVGDRGHILFSDDQGKTWTQARVPTRQLLTAVFFLDDKRGWAVGHDAQILASNDGGATWSKQFEDLTREAPLLDVWFLDAQHGFAVGAYGALLETTDGGQQWQDVAERLDNPDQLHLNAIAAVKDAGLFIVGEQGSMYRSSDAGQTWSRVEGPYEGSLFGVIGTAQPNTLLAYGLRGNLFRSTDFGDSWQPIELNAARGPLEFGLASATLLEDGSLALVGNGGSVLRSHDDGQTFTVYNRSDRIALSGVSGLADGGLLLVGQGGVHLATAEGAEEARP
ncbi:YCF48-related protein [Pseudomonas sp. NPDC089554]|uniref:YCF48-related protein n=1 Tax=Pseudomonas sp. NPDC089554 TaxID=3390653 RepID=UPI003D07C772